MSTAQARLCPPYEASSFLQLVMRGIIRVPGHIAAVERRAVIRRQRISALQAARQVRIGNEDPPERDRIRMTAAIAVSATSPVKPPAVISTPVQIGRNNTIADGTF